MTHPLFCWRHLAFIACMVLMCSTAAAELKTGDRAPDYKLPGSDGKTYELADYAGKQVVVIAWFPKAFTGG